MSTFRRLVRFLAKDGQVYYGDAVLDPGITNIAEAKKARVITGDIFTDYIVTDEIADMDRLLAPLASTRTVRCLGMNYTTHGFKDAEYPVLFYKPMTALTGPKDPIPVHRMAQGDGLDYECELVVAIGKTCLNVPESEALDYVLGYAVGNDVSHRTWQHRCGQWSLGKSFDGWAPYGPGIVSGSLIKDPQTLKITTRVNGKTCQESTTGDMIFTVRKLISFFSQGTTLLPGDLIFTGTPSRISKDLEPPPWLKHGDIVEVEAENIGTCTNQIEFS